MYSSGIHHQCFQSFFLFKALTAIEFGNIFSSIFTITIFLPNGGLVFGYLESYTNSHVVFEVPFL